MMKKTVSVCLFTFVFLGVFLLGFYSNHQTKPQYVYITVKETQIVEKEKIILYFDKLAYPSNNDEVYHQPTQTPFTVTDEYIRSGVWSEIPFDQNKNGEIECSDFIGENPGLDGLLDLAYNRYNLKYLDSNQDNIPCNE